MSPYTIGSITVLEGPAKQPQWSIKDPSRTELPAGHKRYPDSRALPAPIILEQDQILRLRDGTAIRVDIFRPADDAIVPAIAMWGPYGKSGSGFLNLDKFPARAGIPAHRLSGYESFEGLDPAEWVPKGYAIVNVDPRGSGDSEGDVKFWGSAEGRDGHDAVEEIAKLPWCNGKVALAGNSWLAISQYFIAAENPPHLACIAPMEGASDALRETICRGGIPQVPFAAAVRSTLLGRGNVEDMSRMIMSFPHTNEYWEDKRAQFDKVKVPAYIVGSYSSGLHSVGSFRAYEEIPHSDKWFTVHASQEWHDLYSPERTADLQRFFDFYTKDQQNDWKQTPSVRLSLLQFDNRPAVVNQPYENLPWLVANASKQTLHLSPDSSLTTQPTQQAATLTYDPNDESNTGLAFKYSFPTNATLAGPSKLTVHMSAAEADDLDVFVQVSKADKNGRALTHVNQPLADLGVDSLDRVPDLVVCKYFGPTGMLRASRRQVAPQLSGKQWPTLSHESSGEQPIARGEIVRLEIMIWPTGILFDAGEQLVVRVAGKSLALPELPGLPHAPTVNRGSHSVHLGGSYQNCIEFFSLPN